MATIGPRAITSEESAEPGAISRGPEDHRRAHAGGGEPRREDRAAAPRQRMAREEVSGDAGGHAVQHLHEQRHEDARRASCDIASRKIIQKHWPTGREHGQHARRKQPDRCARVEHQRATSARRSSRPRARRAPPRRARCRRRRDTARRCRSGASRPNGTALGVLARASRRHQAPRERARHADHRASSPRTPRATGRAAPARRPTNGPVMAATPHATDTVASMRGQRLRGKDLADHRVDDADGMPPPSPCTARPATMTIIAGARAAQTRLPTTNTTPRHHEASAQARGAQGGRAGRAAHDRRDGVGDRRPRVEREAADVRDDRRQDVAVMKC